MATIKISEMPSATTFEDDDYAMIVQSNNNKKITKTNLFSDIEEEISDVGEEITTLKNGEVYSTTEVKTNKTWIDGKPIYRKVIEYNSPTLGGKYETYDFSNKSIAYFTCFYQKSDGQFEGTFYNTSTDLFRCLLNTSGNQIYYKLGSGMSNVSKVVVTLYYTKTTD